MISRSDISENVDKYLSRSAGISSGDLSSINSSGETSFISLNSFESK